MLYAKYDLGNRWGFAAIKGFEVIRPNATRKAQIMVVFENSDVPTSFNPDQVEFWDEGNEGVLSSCINNVLKKDLGLV